MPFSLPTHPTISLHNRVILVTGAGDGIGKQAALSFAQAGAELILLGRTTEKLAQTYDEIVALNAPEPGIIPLDMQGATQQNYRDMGAMLIEQYGRLDGVLHNASILGSLCPFDQITLAEFDDVMQVNVRAQFMLTQGLLPALRRSADARLLFTTSSVGRKGRAFWGTYSMSKFATEGMMEILAEECQNSNIRVNCLNPGATKTTMRAKAYPAEDSSKLKTPLDIMPYYIYLMSEHSKDINGQSIDCQPKS